MSVNLSSDPAARRAPGRNRRPAFRRAPGLKRLQIAGAAEELFAERGYSATTTAEIAAKAGVSEGILFHHFGSKRALFAHVASEYGRGLAQAMFGTQPGDVAISPAPAVDRAFAYVRENRALFRLFTLREPELAELAASSTHDEIVRALETALRRWGGDGLLRPLNPQVVAELLFALVRGALEACFLRGEEHNEHEYRSELVRCVGRILAPMNDRGPRHPVPSESSGKNPSAIPSTDRSDA